MYFLLLLQLQGQDLFQNQRLHPNHLQNLLLMIYKNCNHLYHHLLKLLLKKLKDFHLLHYN